MTEVTKEDKKGVKGSLMVKGRKSIAYLQKLKDEGTPIVQMCPAIRDQFCVMAAEMAGCDICRLTVPGDGTASIDRKAISPNGGSASSVTPRSLSTSTST